MIKLKTKEGIKVFWSDLTSKNWYLSDWLKESGHFSQTALTSSLGQYLLWMRISPKHIMGSPTSLTSAYLEIKYLMRRQSSLERGKSYGFVLFRLWGCYTVFILGTIWSNVWIVFGKISALVTSYFLCLLTGRESREERRGDGMKEGEGFSWSPPLASSLLSQRSLFLVSDCNKM